MSPENDISVKNCYGLTKMETNTIGKDVWWDHDKHIFRKKRIDLEKIPLIFRCPLCGAVVVPPRERHPKTRELTDWYDIHRQNKAVLDVYFERDKPSQKGFSDWHKKIRAEHEDEFKKNVYIEYFEEPLVLVLHQQFYGTYACKKCIRNHPRRFFKEVECSARVDPKLLECSLF